MCYHLKTRAGISEFNFLDSGFWAPQKVDKKSWPTVTKWSSATLYLRSSAPLAYIKRKRGRKQHEVTAKIQILLSKTQHLCISLRFRYHRTSRSCLQRDQALFYRLCCVAPPCFSTEAQNGGWKKGHSFGCNLPPNPAHRTFIKIMLEAVVCAIVELYCVQLSGVSIILAIPFLINEGRLKSHGWHTYNFSNQDLFLATRWRKVQWPAVLLSLCILTTSKIRLEAIYRERKKRKAADKNTSCVHINSNNKTKRTNDAENDALILKSLTPPPYSLPQRSGLPGW